MPQRIITLTPHLTEICCALGLTDQIAANTTYSDYPLIMKTRLKIGTMKKLNTFEIITLKPDLVLADIAMNNAIQLEELISEGLNVKILSTQTIEEMFQTIANIGRYCDREEEASRLIASLRSRIGRILDIIKPEPSAQKIVVLFNTNPVVSADNRSLVTQIISACNGALLLDDRAKLPQSNSALFLLRQNPDIIIEITVTVYDNQTANPIYRLYEKIENVLQIPAIKNQRRYVIPYAIVTRPGPRIVEGFAAVASSLYPQKEAEILAVLEKNN